MLGKRKYPMSRREFFRRRVRNDIMLDRYSRRLRGTKSRRVRKSRNERTIVSLSPRGAVGMPDSIRVTIPAAYDISSTITAADTQTWNFKGNSLYQFENVDNTNAQLWSKLTDLYSTYTIIGSRCEITVINDSGDVYRVDMYPSTSGTAAAEDDRMIQRYASPTQLLAPNTGGRSQAKISNYVTTKTVFGCSDPMDDPDYSHSTSADPAQLWKWVFIATKMDGTNMAAGDIKFIVKMRYFCVFTEPTNIS